VPEQRNCAGINSDNKTLLQQYEGGVRTTLAFSEFSAYVDDSQHHSDKDSFDL
jgi:hypothetical protein